MYVEIIGKDGMEEFLILILKMKLLKN